MEIAKLALDYLTVLLAWPVTTAAITVATLLIFKNDIRLLMSRVAKIRFPGGSEVSTAQPDPAKEAGKPEKPDVPAGEANKPLPLPQEIQFTQQQLEAVRRLYLSEQANAYLWECRYLNYFLALHTQRVLDWLATMTAPISRSLFDNIWTPYIPLVQERNAVINALQAHYLIIIENDLISITPKGRGYREWRGPLPGPAA